MSTHGRITCDSGNTVLYHVPQWPQMLSRDLRTLWTFSHLTCDEAERFETGLHWSVSHTRYVPCACEREREVRVGFMFIIYVSIWAVREIQGGGGFFQINSMCTKAMKFLVPWDFVSPIPLPHFVPLELLWDSISKQWQTPLCVTIFDDDVSKPSEKKY